MKLKHCVSSKTSVESLRKYFVHLNWIRLATNPRQFDSSMGRAAVYKTEGASSNPARANEFFVGVGSVRNESKLVFEVSKDGSYVSSYTLSKFRHKRIIAFNK